MTNLPDDRKAALIKEFGTLRMQQQDEKSIITALARKYGLEPDEVGAIMKEHESPETKGAAEHPVKKGQLGEAPPKGTAQSGKEPKTD